MGKLTLTALQCPGVRGRVRPSRFSPVHQLLRELLASTLVLTEDWEELADERQEAILQSPDRPALLAALVEHGLLTIHQAARIEAGKTFGLVLGNYRVLDRLGAGGMGVIFQAV